MAKSDAWTELVKQTNRTCYQFDQMNRPLVHDNPPYWDEFVDLPGTDGYDDFLVYPNKDLSKRHPDGLTQLVKTYARRNKIVRVLDIGCGTGRAMMELEQALAKDGLANRMHVHGIGLNGTSIHISDNEYGVVRIPRFTQTDVLDFTPKKPFDVIVSVFAFHYMPDKLAAIERIYNRLLAKDGTALLHLRAGCIQREDPLVEDAQDSARRLNSLFAEWAPNFKDDELSYLLSTRWREPGNVVLQKKNQKKLHFPIKLANVVRHEPKHGTEGYLVSRYHDVEDKR